MNIAIIPVPKCYRWPRRRQNNGVATTQHSPAAFLRSVISWLQISYPDGVPGPDRLPLLEILRSTPLSEDEIEDAVDEVDDPEAEDDDERDVIADFIEEMSHYDASPESIARVAAKLAAAGWPLAGITGFVHADDDQGASNGEAATSQG
jgi:hypothetical protein